MIGHPGKPAAKKAESLLKLERILDGIEQEVINRPVVFATAEDEEQFAALVETSKLYTRRFHQGWMTNQTYEATLKGIYRMMNEIINTKELFV